MFWYMKVENNIFFQKIFFIELHCLQHIFSIHLKYVFNRLKRMICSVICLTQWSMNWISELIILYQLILLVNRTEWFVHELDWFVRDSFMNLYTCSQMSVIQHSSFLVKLNMIVVSIAILSIFILIWTIDLFLPF